MVINKETYEKLIKESPLFDIDKEKENSAYRRERYKLIENLYCYLMAINKEKYEGYACEIMQVAERCINGYDRSVEFLHYFNVAWKNECAHIYGNEKIDDLFRGMKLSKQIQNTMKKYAKIASKCNFDINEEAIYSKLIDVIEMPLEEIKQIEEIMDTKVVWHINDHFDRNKTEILEQIADNFSIEGHFENRESLTELLDKVEAFFEKCQERQKPIIADMLTIEIGMDIFEIKNLSKSYSFISEDVCKQIIQTGRSPTQRDVAKKYGKNEASVSRMMKEFFKKVREREK